LPLPVWSLPEPFPLPWPPVGVAVAVAVVLVWPGGSFRGFGLWEVSVFVTPEVSVGTVTG